MKTILIVDDNAFVRTLVADLLAEQGYSVRTACDGTEAVQTFNVDQIDLVITDLMMPKMSGFELMKELLRRKPGLKIIAVSGAPEKLRDWAPSYGARATICKPFDKNELMVAVRGLLS